MQLYPSVRPQTIGEVLDTAFKIFSTSLLKALPYGMLMTLIGQLGNIFDLASGRPPSRFPPRDWISWLLFALSMIVSLSLWAALFMRQRAIAQGAPVSMRAELASVLHRLPALLLLTILNVLAVGVGFVLLVVPGVYLLIALWMTVPALLLENQAPLDAMKLSLRLIRGNWWRTLAVLLVTIVIVFVFYALSGVFALIVVQFARGADIAVVTATFAVFVISLGAVSTPFLVAITLAIFSDLQSRRALVARRPIREL